MNPGSTTWYADDSDMWPAVDQTKAREVIADPLSPKALKQFCILIRGAMPREQALQAAAILLHHEHESDDYHYSVHLLRESLRELAIAKGVWV